MDNWEIFYWKQYTTTESKKRDREDEPQTNKIDVKRKKQCAEKRKFNT